MVLGKEAKQSAQIKVAFVFVERWATRAYVFMCPSYVINLATAVYPN